MIVIAILGFIVTFSLTLLGFIKVFRHSVRHIKNVLNITSSKINEQQNTQQQIKKVCEYCGNSYESNINKCESCGAKLFKHKE